MFNVAHELAEAERAENAYKYYIGMIDVSVAGTDTYGDLAWHVDCSAFQNGCDTAAEQGHNTYCATSRYVIYTYALTTARMIVDCWQDYYPQLIKETQS